MRKKITPLTLAMLIGASSVPINAFAQDEIDTNVNNSISVLQGSNIQTKSSEMDVDISVLETFQTYTDAIKNTKPTNLNVTLHTSIGKADMENVTIEIPYGFIPDTSDEVFKHFTMTAPIFSLNKVGDNDMIDHYEDLGDKLVIYLKKTKVGVETLNISFAFNQDYNGKIPVDQIIWHNAQAIMKDGDGSIIKESSPKQVKTNVTNNMVVNVERQNPEDTVLTGKKISFKVQYRNDNNSWSLLDTSDPEINKMYIEVPTGSELSPALESYFTGKEVTSDEDASIPKGYSRYYRQLTDDKNTFSNWNVGNAGLNYKDIQAYIILPDSVDVGDEVNIKTGMIYKKINGKVSEVTDQANYIKEDKKEWAIYTSDRQISYDGRYYVVQKSDKEDTSCKIYVGELEYDSKYTTKNTGKRAIKNTKIYLKQPDSGSEKMNFKSIDVVGLVEDETVAKGQYKVELEIKNAKTGATRIVEGGTGEEVSVTLPDLQNNEYINQVIVIPMGTDGISEGQLPSGNGFSIKYVAKNWSENYWPDGTAIPQDKVNKINMNWSMNYLDETEGQTPTQTTLKGKEQTMYYVPPHTTDGRVVFVSSNAQKVEPSDYVDYEITGYNEYYSVADSINNPEIGVAIPKVLELQEPDALKQFIDKKNSKTYDNAVEVTLVSSDDNYNYYRFNVTGVAYKNLKNIAFSIPLRLKVKDGTPVGTYKIPYATISHRNAPCFVQYTTNNLKDDVAKAFGYDNTKLSSYEGFTKDHTNLTVAHSTKLSSNSEGRKDANDEWTDSSFFAIEKGGKPQAKIEVTNSGNTTFDSLRIYNILPSVEDGRGSEGNVTFTGLDSVDGGTVYYTTKPVADLPKYNTDLQDWDNKKLTELGFSKTAPTDLSTVTAIYVQFDNKDILPAETMSVILNFSVPNADDQTAINQFQYSAKEKNTGIHLNTQSNLMTMSTEVAKVDYEENLPSILVEGFENAGNMPTSQNELLDVDGNAQITISNKIPTLKGYTFKHWVDEKGNVYNPNDVVDFSKDNQKTKLLLKAVWELADIDVNVIYNENYGNSPKEELKKYKFGDTVKLSNVTTPVRDGYTFKGWSKSKTATSPDFLDNSKIDFTDDKTVYAIWEANSYVIKFNANSGTGKMNDLSMTYDIAKKLTKNTFTKTGYKFKGWATTPTGKVVYIDETEVKNLLNEANGSITLYAIWDINSYDVTFDSQGGSSVNGQNVEYDALVNKPTNPTKAGYTFGGWYKESNCTTEWNFNKDKMPASGLTLYAKWILNASKLNQAPTITASDKVLTVGDEFDPLAGVSAYDEEDKDIILTEANIISDDVDMTKAGTYSVTYKVTDSQGASTSKTIVVVVNPKMSKLNKIPTINASDKVLTVGDEFDPLAGVSAYDEEDKDIILTEANIISDDVDMTKAGTYSVTYKVTDSQGASALKTIIVVVYPKMAELNQAPTINASDKELTVGDKFDPLAGVTAYDEEDKDIILTKANIIFNNVDMTKAGTYRITYKVTDSQGASALKTITVTVKEKVEISVDNNENNSSTTQNKNPKTGDNTSLSAYLGTLIVACLGMINILKKKAK